MTLWLHITGENANTRAEEAPARAARISSRREMPSARRAPSRSDENRETSIAVRPAASAPQNADITAIAHAGLGCPRKETQERRREKIHAHIVQEG